MPVEVRDSIHSDIANQFPDVYKDNSDFLIGFIEAYYEHLDEKIDRDLPRIRDIDTTLSAFFVYYRNKYMSSLPLSVNPPIDVRFILKHVTNLYIRKGTKESLELLFKMFFDEDIEIEYPGNNVLKASDSVWGGETFIEMKTVYDTSEYPIERGNTIIGDLSKAQAFIDGVVFVNFSGSLTPIIYLSQQRGVFTAEDSLEVRGADENGQDFIKNVGKMIAGSMTNVNINRTGRVPGQEVGDLVEIRSRRSGVGAKGVITKVSEEAVGEIEYEILDGGFGYIDPNSIRIGGSLQQYVDEQTVKVSNQVIILEGDEAIDIKPGDSLVFPGSTINYDNVETPTDGRQKPRYSITGAGIVTSYHHPIVFLNTEKNKNELFEFLADTYRTGGFYRNKLYDSFFNAYQIATPTPSQPAFPVPDLSLMKVITDEEVSGKGILGSFTGKPKPTGTVSTASGAGHNEITLSEPNAILNFVVGDTITSISPSNTYGKAIIKNKTNSTNTLLLEVFTEGEVLTSRHSSGATVTVVSVADNVYTVPSNGANPSGFAPGEILDGANGMTAKITARNTGANTITAEPFGNATIIQGASGRDYVGDLSIGSNVVQLDDVEILSNYLLGANNGFYDGGSDNDDWITIDDTTPLESQGAQGTSAIETDIIDRTPTISPVIPSTETTSVDQVFLHQLKHGQLYTVVHPGTNLTTSDWVKIGAEKGFIGEDFIFDSTLLSQLNPDVVELSGDDLVVSTLERFDAVFSPVKQTYALLLNYLVKQGVSPKVTVGSAFKPTDNHDAYDNYFTNIQDLVVGREYSILDFGDNTYQDWINSGFAIDNLAEPSTILHTFPTDYVGKVIPGRKYLVKTLGNTNWELLGGTGETQVGDIVTIPKTAPASLTSTGSVVDIAKIHQYTGVTFTATSLPAAYSLVGSTGLCVDWNNVRGTLTDPNASTVDTKLFTSGGVFVNPELSGSEESRTAPTEVLSTGTFKAYINGRYDKSIKCASLSALNESSNLELDSIDDAEIITVTRDKIGDYYREIIDPNTAGVLDASNPYSDGNYDMLGIGSVENINTSLGDAFGQVTFRMGSLKSIIQNQPGTNYQNDVGVRVVNRLIESLNKKDIIVNFANADFQLEFGEMITQDIILPSEAIDTVNNISSDVIQTLGTDTFDADPLRPYGNSSTSFSFGDKEYTTKGKFLKQDGRDYYFRPMSFYGFDSEIPITIRSIERQITSIRQDEESQPMGANAVISGSASYASGQIEEVSITHTGYKYGTGSVVDIVNKVEDNPNYNQIVASANVESYGQGNTLGRWKTSSSFLNHADIRIHDNDYYQEYSYNVKAITDPEIYTPLVKDVVGVAGTKMFTTPLINSVNSVETNLTSEIIFFKVGNVDLHTEPTGYNESFTSLVGTVTQVTLNGANTLLTGSGFNVNANDLIRVSGDNTGTGVLPLDEFRDSDNLDPLPVTYKVSSATPTTINLTTELGGLIDGVIPGTLSGLTFDTVTRTTVGGDGETLTTEAGDNLKGIQVSAEGSIVDE